MDRHQLAHEYHSALHRVFLLDYDGTLRPLVDHPSEATPPAEVHDILSTLTKDPDTTVAIVSGRDRLTLEQWLGDLPIHLIAEHSNAYREPGQDWQLAAPDNPAWIPRVQDVMQTAVDKLPGSHIERKPAENPSSLAWHYRQARRPEPTLKRLRGALQPLANEYGLQLLDGNKVLDVHAESIDKGSGVQRWLGPLLHGFILAAGDDTTDEKLFGAMPYQAVTIKIGPGATMAKYRLPGPPELLALLRDITSKG